MSQDEQHHIDEPEPASPEPPPHDDSDFLMPGPTATSNEGCFAWGASWLIVSLVMILIVAIMTVTCYFLALLFNLL